MDPYGFICRIKFFDKPDPIPHRYKKKNEETQMRRFKMFNSVLPMKYKATHIKTFSELTE